MVSKSAYVQEKGITLISLTITIIILLILAGVTINLALGENGIFKISKMATSNYTNAQEQEMDEINDFTKELQHITKGINYDEKVEAKDYDTLQAAIDAAPDNVKTLINVQRDYIENVTVSTSKDVIIDFNGHKLEDDESSRSSTVTVSGKLVIIDGTITMNTNHGSYALGAIRNEQDGIVLIKEGVNISSRTYVGIYNEGETTINGGNISSEATYGIDNQSNGKLLIKGGSISSKSSKGIMNRGTIIMEQGVIISEEEGINNQPSGTITIKNGIIKSRIVNFGTLVVKGGNIINTKKSYGIDNQSKGILTVNGGNVKSEKSAGIGNQGIATITGGTVNSEDSYGIYNIGTITINGGTIFSENPSSYGLYNDRGTVTITGGDISSTYGCN